VFGSSINTIDARGTAVAATLTNVNSNAAINFAAGAGGSLSATYADSNGVNDAVTVTLQGGAASTLAVPVVQTVASLTLQDANSNGIGTLNLVDNNVGFNSSDIITSLTDATLNTLNVSGTGGLTIS